MAQERLDKLLSSTGRWSRREVKELIRQGRVRVDGVPARRPEEKCEPEAAGLTVDGERVDCAPFVYLMLHKPAGLLSATEDRRDRTVVSLLPDAARKDLFPVGRLDKDTEGLLLLTNDGALAHALLSPKRHVDKTYYAVVSGKPGQREQELFAEGLDIGDEKKTFPARLEILSSREEENGAGGKAWRSEVKITIREGRFHQIKRMFEAVDMEVLFLKRLTMGPLVLDEILEPGQARLLTEEELLALKQT